jgi:hypothetical protein
MRAITARRDPMKTQGAAILHLLLCIFLTVAAFAQSREVKSISYLQKVRTFYTAEEFARMTKGKVKLHRDARRPGYDLTPLQSVLPAGPVKICARESNLSIFWIGTDQGAIRHNISLRFGLRDKAPWETNDWAFEYFAGKRWLPDDRVTGIGFETNGSGNDITWLETPKGFSRVEYKEMTLAEKSKAFVERVRARHVRHGLTADSMLQTPGDLSTNRTVSSDNDGLWTQMYVAAEVFRHRVTGEADARANARQGFEAMLRLEEITGIPGFHARSFIKVGEDVQPQDGEWRDTADGKWRWKGDTSSDEIVGHYFGYAVYYDLVADEAEKQKIRGVVTRMTDHILNNNYQLIDVDGKRTRWGWWGPEEIWADPDETGLRALHILSHLRAAIHITGSPRYEQAYNELISKHRYHLLTRNQKVNYPGRVNHSDDELAFLSYYPLFNYESDPKLREVYVQSLERSWQVERPERNPLWNFIYAVGSGGKEFDRSEALLTLKQIPMDQISWAVANSHRLDVPIDNLNDRFDRKQALTVLPYDELPMSKWNGNPYRLDGGNGGRNEGDGVYFLLPYWMGRYHKLIDD